MKHYFLRIQRQSRELEDDIGEADEVDEGAREIAGETTGGTSMSFSQIYHGLE